MTFVTEHNAVPGSSVSPSVSDQKGTKMHSDQTKVAPMILTYTHWLYCMCIYSSLTPRLLDLILSWITLATYLGMFISTIGIFENAEKVGPFVYMALPLLGLIVAEFFRVLTMPLTLHDSLTLWGGVQIVHNICDIQSLLSMAVLFSGFDLSALAGNGIVSYELPHTLELSFWILLAIVCIALQCFTYRRWPIIIFYCFLWCNHGLFLTVTDRELHSWRSLTGVSSFMIAPIFLLMEWKNLRPSIRRWGGYISFRHAYQILTALSYYFYMSDILARFVGFM